MQHTYYKCPDSCSKDHCMFCHGGLCHCTKCNGFEGSLPVECPGEKMEKTTADDVYAGRIQFCAGKWWVPKEAG